MTTHFSDSNGAMNQVSAFLRRLADHLHRQATSTKILELDQKLATKNSMTTPDAALGEIIRRAWTVGRRIDLSGVGYGPAEWNDGKHFDDTPFPYYFFLAGLVRSQNCKRIFEIGTNYGGSALAMLRGVANQNEAEIVTVDITDLNPKVRDTRGITKIVGDANSEAVIKLAVLTMGGAPIDLLYVDAAHQFLPTITNLGLYILLLQPRFVVIDDILLKEGMRSLWDAIRITQGARAVNCSDLVPEIRSANVGFGLLRLR